jgi:hypothetical protein
MAYNQERLKRQNLRHSDRTLEKRYKWSSIPKSPKLPSLNGLTEHGGLFDDLRTCLFFGC